MTEVVEVVVVFAWLVSGGMSVGGVVFEWGIVAL
jgi:hypothetical protein